jgi:hypothetical protein
MKKILIAAVLSAFLVPAASSGFAANKGNRYAPGHKQTNPGDAKKFAPGHLQQNPGDAKNFAPGRRNSDR